MSSEEINEKTEGAAADEATQKSAGKSKITAPTGHGNVAQSRQTDFPDKSGFRNSANVRSKALKKKRRKK